MPPPPEFSKRLEILLHRAEVRMERSIKSEPLREWVIEHASKDIASVIRYSQDDVAVVAACRALFQLVDEWWADT